MAIKISSSKLSIFLECPYQYFLTYQIKPKPEVPQWVRKVFGTAIHLTIRYFYRPNEKIRLQRLKENKTQIFPNSEDSAKGIWTMVWSEALKEEKANPKIFPRPCKIRFEGKSKEEVKQEKEMFFGWGANIVKKYWRDNYNTPFPVAVEKRFNVPAPHRTDINLVGSIDQIRKIKDQYWLVDLKTWLRNGELDDARVQYPHHHNYQFTIYSWAFRQCYQKEEEGIIIYPLGDQKNPHNEERIDKAAIITVRCEKDYSDLAELIDFFIGCLEIGLFPKNYGYSCLSCDYLKICAKDELFTTNPVLVSDIAWGRINKTRLKKELEPKAKELAFHQPRLKF